jgi:hypothetical protein
MSDRCRACRSLFAAAFTKLTQKFLGRHKERILLEDAADDDHRMRAHDVNHDFSSKFAEMAGAEDCVVYGLMSG